MKAQRIGGDLHGYYRMHAPWYDLTRGSFLFGRKQLLLDLGELWWERHGDSPPRVLEIGCGTGRNLSWLRSLWPGAELTGVELTDAMLEQARRRLPDAVKLIPADVLAWQHGQKYDWVICSYMLSMCGANRRAIEKRARDLLAPGGMLAIVDFHQTPLAWFERWMGRNHVGFDAAWPERAASGLEIKLQRSQSAYARCWQYASLIAQDSR